LNALRKKTSPSSPSGFTTALSRRFKHWRRTRVHPVAGSKHDWRIRVGVYGVVYEIADEIRVVRVNRVRHRREVYR
jgi:mRNA-degrading endonuclease RelE of RelBE toxin-antitoxin system